MLHLPIHVCKPSQLIIQVVEGCAISPINYLAAGLFKDVRVKYNNTSLPDSTKQMYYFQTLISMMMNMKDLNAQVNFQPGLWYPDTPNSKIDMVKPFAENEGLTSRFTR